LFIDLKLDGKIVVFVGGGLEAHRKIQNFLDSGAKITVVSEEFSAGIKHLAEENKILLVKKQVKTASAFLGSLGFKPDVVLAATSNSALNAQLVTEAKKFGCIVYAVDNPALSDFIFPAVARVGDVKIAFSTSGKSPAVAKELRQRIERLVTPADLAEISLQSAMRSYIKQRVPRQSDRSRILSEILNNVEIKQALSDGKLCEAKDLAIKLVQNWEA
jgi:precorrin-2 dehydrogenase / sirohydrochlorin ferrochelatase